MNKFVISAILIASVVACKPAPHASEPTKMRLSPPSLQIDASTPDRALKSYWQLMDNFWLSHNSWLKASFDSLDLDAYRPHFATLATGNISAFYDRRSKPKAQPLDRYEREILEVKQESASRAVVFVKIRNVTPLPEGAVLSERQTRNRHDGFDVKYVMEKDSDGWKVADVYVRNEWGPSSSEDKWDHPAGLKAPKDQVPNRIRHY